MSEVAYTDDDIGTEVSTVIEGIQYFDTVIECWLPDGQRIVGPRLKCAHLFARFSMIPQMEMVSEAVATHQDEGA